MKWEKTITLATVVGMMVLALRLFSPTSHESIGLYNMWVTFVANWEIFAILALATSIVVRFQNQMKKTYDRVGKFIVDIEEIKEDIKWIHINIKDLGEELKRHQTQSPKEIEIERELLLTKEKQDS